MKHTMEEVKALIPEELSLRISELSDDVKELALAYLVGKYTKELNCIWSADSFQAVLAKNARKHLGIRFSDEVQRSRTIEELKEMSPLKRAMYKAQDLPGKREVFQET